MLFMLSFGRPIELSRHRAGSTILCIFVFSDESEEQGSDRVMRTAPLSIKLQLHGTVKYGSNGNGVNIRNGIIALHY